MRLRISIRGSSVRSSIRPPLRRSVGHAFFFIAEIGQKCSENMQLTQFNSFIHLFIHSCIHAFRRIVVRLELVEQFKDITLAHKKNWNKTSQLNMSISPWTIWPRLRWVFAILCAATVKVEKKILPENSCAYKWAYDFRQSHTDQHWHQCSIIII